MVYRIKRLTKSSSLKLFSATIIISLIIAILGWFLVGFVVTFDKLSFNPALEDVNSDNDSPITICTAYGSADCDWITYYDLERIKDHQINLKYSNEIENLKLLIESSKIIPVESTLNQTVNLYQTSFNLNYVLNFNDSSLNTYNSTFEANINGESFQCLDVELTSGDGCSYTFEPAIRLYRNSSVDCNTDTISCLVPAIAILFDPSNQEILCDNYWSGCNYEPTSLLKDLRTGFYDKTENGQKSTTWATGALVDIKFLGDKSVSNIFCDLEVGGTNPDCLEMGINPDSLIKDYFVFKHSESLNYGIGNVQLIDVFTQNEINLIETPTEFTNSDSICTVMLPSKDFSASLDKSSILCTNGDIYNNLGVRILNYDSDNDPQLILKLDTTTNKLVLSIATKIQRSSTGLTDVLYSIVSNPLYIFRSFDNPEFRNIVFMSIFLIFINIFLAFLLILFRVWSVSSKLFSGRIALLLHGKLGKLLDLTQFFNLSGDWYIENVAIHDYNFTDVKITLKDLLINRWRDILFFPAALTATIGVGIVILTSPELYFFTILLAPFVVLILIFWIPILWTLEDGGLKNVNWANTGEITSLNRVSSTLRDGFNKLVGFSAVFGIGTAGSTAFRSRFSGESYEGTEFIKASFQGFIDFNINYFLSVILWTVGLFLIISSICISGIIITSIAYLNNHHLNRIKEFRDHMHNNNVFQGTTQQFFNHKKDDKTLYHIE